MCALVSLAITSCGTDDPATRAATLDRATTSMEVTTTVEQTETSTAGDSTPTSLTTLVPCGRPIVDAPVTTGGADESAVPVSIIGDPALAPLSDDERNQRAGLGLPDLGYDELTADLDAARASLAETGMRLTAAELAEFRARQALAVPASQLFQQAWALDNFGGFFFDPLTGQYVLRVVGPTDAAERLADVLPAERIRIEQAEYTMAELKAVADQIVPVRDDGTVDVAALTEPYATLVNQGKIGVGIDHTLNRVLVVVTADVPCEVVAQIASVLGAHGEIGEMGNASLEQAAAE